MTVEELEETIDRLNRKYAALGRVLEIVSAKVAIE